MFLYDAFISYSHAQDKPLAAALQSVMQRLGKPWHRRRALRVFRDDTSLAATPELWPSIEQALAQSRYLIVLASPQLARSKWCAMEIDYWLEHRDIDTLLIAVGAGDLAWDEAARDFHWTETTPLPPSLKGRSSHEPKWIDLRPWRDAPDAREPAFADAAADLAAAVHGIPKEDLLSQELRQQKRALRLAWLAAAVLLALVGVAGWQWAEAVSQRREALAQRATAEQQRDLAQRNLTLARKAAEDLVFKVVQGLRDVEGMRSDTVRQILETAQSVMDELVQSAPDDRELLRARTAMFLEFAQTYMQVGDSERALAAVEEALKILRTFLASEPDSVGPLTNYATALEIVGEVKAAQGDISAARAAFDESLALRRRLVSTHPGEKSLPYDLAVALLKFADVKLAQGDRPGALAAYEESLVLARKGVAAVGQEDDWHRVAYAALSRIGKFRSEAREWELALAAFEEALPLVRRHAARAPENAERQRDIQVLLIHIGITRHARGDRARALEAYEEAVSIMRRLVAIDPNRVEWRFDLAYALYCESTAAETPRARAALAEAVALLEALERDGKLTAAQRVHFATITQARARLPPEGLRLP